MNDGRMDISTEDLRAFLALADERSFTRAAARCHRSQSAFSARIRALEITLGTQLFARTTRSVDLTPEGELFEKSARQLHGEFTDMVAHFGDYAARRKNRVTVAVLPSIAAAWMPRLFTALREAHPGIELRPVDMMSDACLDMMRAGQADLAITSTPADADDLEDIVLGVESFFLVCVASHPLLRKPHVVPADLAEHPFVHLAHGSSVRLHVEAAVRPVRLRTAMEARYLATVAAMIAADFGITIVPGLTLTHFRRRGLEVRRLDFPGLQRMIHLVRRRGRSSPAADIVHALLLRELEALEGLRRTEGIETIVPVQGRTRASARRRRTP